MFVYMCGRTYVILYFDPCIFVLIAWWTFTSDKLNECSLTVIFVYKL